jgi:hypothetical protein
MTQLLDKFRELPDYRKCKQLKFNVGKVFFMSLLTTLNNLSPTKKLNTNINLLILP